MANFGKKILSAFVEVNDDKKKEAEKPPSTEYMPKAIPVPLTHLYQRNCSKQLCITGKQQVRSLF